ncbi:MAG: hypothetical protein RL199_17 [Pseudomonadota bacterium]
MRLPAARLLLGLWWLEAVDDADSQLHDMVGDRMSAKAWGRRRLTRWQQAVVVARFWAEFGDQHERDEASRIIRRLVSRARRYSVDLVVD